MSARVLHTSQGRMVQEGDRSPCSSPFPTKVSDSPPRNHRIIGGVYVTKTSFTRHDPNEETLDVHNSRSKTVLSVSRCMVGGGRKVWVDGLRCSTRVPTAGDFVDLRTTDTT